jgi:amino acid transporter
MSPELEAIHEKVCGEEYKRAGKKIAVVALVFGILTTVLIVLYAKHHQELSGVAGIYAFVYLIISCIFTLFAGHTCLTLWAIQTHDRRWKAVVDK